VQALSRVKNDLEVVVSEPMLRVALVEERHHQVLQRKAGMSDTAEMTATCTTSSSEMANIAEHDGLILTGAGQIEAIARPSANSAVKTSPMTASSRRRDFA
jgi:hypothetical protein